MTLIAAATALAVVAPPSGPADADARTLAKGRFGPTEKYTGTGTARVVRVRGGRELRLSRNFTARGAIRLRMWLATDSSGRRRVDLGPMRKSGAQRFRLPRGVSIRRFDTVIAWCIAVNEPVTDAVLR